MKRCLLISATVCYIPGLQRSILTTQVPVEHWFLPAAFGLGLLGFRRGEEVGYSYVSERLLHEDGVVGPPI